MHDVAREVTIIGDSAYVAASYAGLRIIDISHLPDSLTEVNYYNSPGKSFDVSINNNVAYLSDAGHSLRIVDLTTNPDTEITYFDTPSYNYGVDVQGNYAYIAGTGKGLRVIDFSDAANPKEVGSYYSDAYVNNLSTHTFFYNVKVVDHYVYAANSTAGLMVLDVIDNTAPTEVKVVDTPGQALDIAIDGNYAYIADNSGGLCIMDISTPSNPTISGSYNLINHAEGVAVQGNYAYVADGINGLYMFDISDKSKPRLINYQDTPGEALKVAVSGNFAYVADASSGLQIINISDTVNLPIVGTYDTHYRAQGIAIEGKLAYVADGGDGIRIIDVSDSSSPMEKGYLITPSEAANVIVRNDTVFEADTDDEMMILRNEVATPVELYSFNAKYSGSTVALDWKTATEINNYGFNVERKKDNGNWEDIGFVHGNGNSNSIKEYGYIDKELTGSSKWYYRLKQIDNSGSYKYSNIVNVSVTPSTFSLSQNYPNPFNPSTKIKYSLPVASHVKLVIYDILGNQIKTLVDKNQEPGFYETKFDGKDLSSGVYIYQLKTDQFVSTKKMILTK